MHRIASITSPWMTINVDRDVPSLGKTSEYWTVGKPDSLIVVPFQGDFVHTIRSTYRHGVQHETEDFPGGRVHPGRDLETQAVRILERECPDGLTNFIDALEVHHRGAYVDSSTLSSSVYVAFARVGDGWEGGPSCQAHKLATMSSLWKFTQAMDCMQCSYAACVWFMSSSGPSPLGTSRTSQP